MYLYNVGINVTIKNFVFLFLYSVLRIHFSDVYDVCWCMCDFNIIIYCNNKSIHCLTAYLSSTRSKYWLNWLCLYTFLRMRLFV